METFLLRQYLIMVLVRKNKKRIHSCLAHIDIIDGKLLPDALRLRSILKFGWLGADKKRIKIKLLAPMALATKFEYFL